MQRQRLADQIAVRLENMIETGQFKSGERLPAERNLAESLGVSRPSLREAIQKLSSKGLVYTRPGGGSYVTEKAQPSKQETKSFEALADPLVDLMNERVEARFDILEVRYALEGVAAYYAALRATNEDREKIQEKFSRMIEQHGNEDPMDEIRADAAFHLSIVEASHNQILLHIMHSLFDLLQKSVQHNLSQIYTLPRVFEPLSRQHENLMNAILEGKAERAKAAAQEHMVFVEESLQRVEQIEMEQYRALRRLSIE